MQEIKYCAIKYIRLSDADEKPGESDSIGNQRKLIDEFLKKHPEIEVVGEKIDDGFSGIIFDRPRFQEMMEEIKAGRVNCCIVKDLSRFGREFIETGRYLRYIFPSYGVRFIAINDNIDTLTDSGDDLAISIKTLMNDSYCLDTSKKTRSALETRRREGYYTGACPVYGYKKSDENHNLLVIDEYPANIVREIFNMKINGLSSARIADTLNERGVLSPHRYKIDRGLPHPKKGFADKADAKWSAMAVIRVLKDETYTGTLIQGIYTTPNYKVKNVVEKPSCEWARTENAHEAVINKNLFNLTQKILRLDTRTSPKSDAVYIFSGLLICGCCGTRMVRKTVPSRGVKYYYYWCPTTKKRGCDGSVMLREDELTEVVLISLKAHIANVASLESILESLDANRVSRELAKTLTVQVAENERHLEKIRNIKATLSESMLTGILTKDEYNSMKAQYAEDADNLLAANERLKREIDDVLSCRHERLAWIAHFKEFASLKELDRKTVINLVQYIKVLGKDDIEIYFNYQSEYEAALTIMQGEA